MTFLRSDNHGIPVVSLSPLFSEVSGLPDTSCPPVSKTDHFKGLYTNDVLFQSLIRTWDMMVSHHKITNNYSNEEVP